MARRGTIYTYSVVRSGTAEFKDETPYVLAVVEENERKSMARIEGYTEKTAISIGMEVEFLSVDGDGNATYTFV